MPIPVLAYKVKADLTSSVGQSTNRVRGEFDRSRRYIAGMNAELRQTQTLIGKVNSQKLNASFGIGGGNDAASRGADVAAYGAELDRLRARFNPLFAAQQHYRAQLDEIRTAHRLGAISASEQAAAIARTKAAFAGQVHMINGTAGAMNAYAGATRLGTFQTANLAAQLNDIGVQLAAGTSPFQIAIQQGTQINQVLGQQGMRGALAGIAGAFGSLISPVSLATFAIIGGTGALIQYLAAGSGPEAKAVEEQLERFNTLVGDLERGYGQASDAAEGFYEVASRKSAAEEIRRIRDEQSRLRDQIAASRTAISGFYDDAVAQVAQIRGGAGDFEGIVAAGADQLELQVLRVGEVVERFQDGKIEAGDLAEILSDMQLNGTLAPDVERLTDQIIDAAQEAHILAAQLGGLGAASRAISSADDAANGRVGGAFGIFGEADALDRLRGELGKNKPKRDRGASEIERQRQAVKDLISDLAFEQEQMGRNSTEQRVQAELRRAGAVATDDQRTAIRAYVEANEQAYEAQERFNEITQFSGSLVKDVFSDMISGAASFEDSLKRVALAIAEAALEAALLGQGPLAALFGTGPVGGNSVGGLFGSLFAGFFAEGGNIPAGKVGIAGEGGIPELIAGPANVIPLRGMNGGDTYASTYNVDARGAQEGVGEQIVAALKVYDRDRAPATIKTVMRRALRDDTTFR